jgi:CheY-like chemotaxis protein/anti-sigma regulatory factor (Ser/Thr protein kinase)
VNPEFPPDLRLLGDPTRIRQVIINLLSNAVKFTREGSVTLRVVAHPRSDGRITLSVSVTDTGPGISTEQQSRLFTRFVQGDRSVYRQFGGTGLGLAIVKRLLDTMGGSINVVSTPGQGSSFRVVITLPIAPKPNTQSPQAPPLSGEPLDILIVDDVALNRDLLHRLLAADGHRITEAADGAAALTATSQRRFDLVMLDIEMPGMNGLDVCRKIRAGQGPNRATRIVALTGYAFESDVAQAMAAGMNAHLAKPIMVGALRAQIDTLRAGGSP